MSHCDPGCIFRSEHLSAAQIGLRCNSAATQRALLSRACVSDFINPSASTYRASNREASDQNINQQGFKCKLSPHSVQKCSALSLVCLCNTEDEPVENFSRVFKI